MSKTKIPLARFRVGETVNVRDEEASSPPSFQAVVISIRFDQYQKQFDYAVLEVEGAGYVDGYTEDWLSPINEDGAAMSLDDILKVRDDDVWREIAKYPREDWRYEVGNGDTNLGYWDWVIHQWESE